MGLDMFAYRTKVQLSKQVDFQEEVYPKNEDGSQQEGICDEIMYWRKHPNLHGWMEKLYYEKGGDSDCFNCVPVEITLEDLDLLEKDITQDQLPFTEGFFFGSSDEGPNEKDIAFIRAAREAIAEGDRVFYDSWW